MPRTPPDADFPCWRYWVGLGEAPCTFTRCVFYTQAAPCGCRLNDPRREHTVPEIALRLGISTEEVDRDIRRGLVAARRAVLIRDMVDGVT